MGRHGTSLQLLTDTNRVALQSLAFVKTVQQYPPADFNVLFPSVSEDGANLGCNLILVMLKDDFF